MAKNEVIKETKADRGMEILLEKINAIAVNQNNISKEIAMLKSGRQEAQAMAVNKKIYNPTPTIKFEVVSNGFNDLAVKLRAKLKKYSKLERVEILGRIVPNVQYKQFVTQDSEGNTKFDGTFKSDVKAVVKLYNDDGTIRYQTWWATGSNDKQVHTSVKPEELA